MSKYIRKLDCPELDVKEKLNSSDYFELVYLRHRYFRQSTNPSPARLAQFENMIVNMANKVYSKNVTVLKTTGMEVEDVQNIGRIHAISFISMGGLQENPDLMKKFIKAHKRLKGKNSDPTDRDIFLRESYNLAAFLRQRLPELVRFCRSKNVNIRGTKPVKCFYVGDPNRSPTDYDLYVSPEVFGYEKIHETEYKKMVKKNGGKKTGFLNEDGLTVRAVYMEGSYLTPDDIDQSDLDPRRSSFYRSPEDTLSVCEGYKTGAIKDFE